MSDRSVEKIIHIFCPNCGSGSRTTEKEYEEVDEIKCWHCRGTFNSDWWETNE